MYGGDQNNSDRLTGNEYNSSLYGERGNDTLLGGNGDDFLVGYSDGSEFDFLTGGARIDTFTLGDTTGVGDWFGSTAQDTAVFLGNDFVSIMQDSSNVNFTRDFVFV